MKCQKCNRVLESIWTFCPFCGEKIKLDDFIDPRDGQRYKIVKIGSQTWMAENLRYKCDGARAYKDEPAFIQEYGLLYNRKASRVVAPVGWRLPSIADFQHLEDFVGTPKLLKKSFAWKDSLDDPFGFGALPAGYCCWQGSANGLGRFTSFWTSSGNDFYHEGSFYEIGEFDYDELGDSFVEFISIRLIKDD